MAATREHRVCKGVGTRLAFRFSVRGDFLMSSQVEFGAETFRCPRPGGLGSHRGMRRHVECRSLEWCGDLGREGGELIRVNIVRGVFFI